MDNEFEKLSTKECYNKLNSSSSGLSSSDVEQRIRQYGKNEVVEKKENAVLKFLKKFWAPVPWMLEITAIITFFIGKDLDTYIILSLLIFNSFISFFQESRASDAVEMLRSRITVKTRVLRNGSWEQIISTELVPGDVVHVRMGDVVPADVKIERGKVEVDQSALTGESNPVRRGENGEIFSGSIVKKGEATGLVVATGAKTLFGHTAELVSSAKSESHLEKLILSIVKYLAVIDVILVLGLVVFSFIYNVPLIDAIPFSLVVLIASIPVALPATFTIATAYGAIDLSKKGALVTRLNAVEDAASMDSICFDKTGTLTKNELTVQEPVLFESSREDITRYAMLASDESSLDSIDLAIINFGKSAGVNMEGYRITDFTPFEPATKRTQAKVETPDGMITVTKGAPQVLAAMCPGIKVDEVMEKARELSLRGYRTIAVAVNDGTTWKFSGLIPMHDPPRDDSKELIGKLRDMGIVPRMITGDSTPIAEEIAKEVGIGQNVSRVSDVISGKTKVDDCNAFAEVFPEDKFSIVKILQKEGHITGMTGDGVNDAPALKQAEVGIAVASATDVAKASASIVLTHEGLTDIVSAVEDGRKIFQRMLTYTLNKIIKTVQVAIFLTTSFFIFRFFVTTPFDIILLLFANDFVTMSIATDNVRFSKNPEKWNVRSLVGSSFSLAMFIVVESFAILIIGMRLGLNNNQIHTFIFDMLVFSGQFTVYMVRERGRFWNSRPSKWLLSATVADLIFISLISWLGILVTAIPLRNILLVLALTFLSMAIIDLGKNYIFRHYGI
ncbi:plasma-membrane proton-efflux P-type ATPase [Cuniculiplasma divulgatum]|uniref:H(+)-transporting P-type ATPase n=1 Tax=Cuniculiplasma divulgatum TaxID=1673428 RepID=A0A1N5S8U5_9ARCH|nr:plasma-membrane proton-efflux P-type ATPase [Cuniculiplasma divulgatum]SIM32390.1 H(+)-transporting P-type ATPase [Cuniculiplasma divulgatum]